MVDRVEDGPTLQELLRRQRYLRTSLQRVQRAINAGGLTANQIKIQMGFLDEIQVVRNS